MHYETLLADLFHTPDHLDRKYIIKTRFLLEKLYYAITDKCYLIALDLCDKVVESARMHTHPNHDDDFIILDKVQESLYDYIQ